MSRMFTLITLRLKAELSVIGAIVTVFFLAAAVLPLVSPALAQPLSIDKLDSLCRNHDPLTYEDSLFGWYPYLTNELQTPVLSTDGRLLAYALIQYVDPYFVGTAVTEAASGRRIALLEGVGLGKWSPGGSLLLTNAITYDPVRDTSWENCRWNWGQRSFWAADGRSVYIFDDQIYRCSPDGGGLERLGKFRADLPVGDERFVYFHYGSADTLHRDTYSMYSLKSRVDSIISAPDLSQIMFVRYPSISPDQSHIAADFLEYGNNRFNGKQFLGVFDLRTNRLRKVLPSQVLGNYYYPSWTPSGTLLVAFACRCDSVSMVWEVDTHGVFLRKLVGRENFGLLMSAGQTASVPNAFSDIHVYPQPGRNSVLLEYQATTDEPLISVLDLQGRELLALRPGVDGNNRRQLVRIPTSGFAPGVYLVRIAFGVKLSIFGRFVIE